MSDSYDDDDDLKSVAFTGPQLAALQDIISEHPLVDYLTESLEVARNEIDTLKVKVEELTLSKGGELTPNGVRIAMGMKPVFSPLQKAIVIREGLLKYIADNGNDNGVVGDVYGVLVANWEHPSLKPYLPPQFRENFEEIKRVVQQSRRGGVKLLAKYTNAMGWQKKPNYAFFIK